MKHTRARGSTFRAVFEHSPDALLLADDRGRYLDANPAACTFLGFDRSHILGRTIQDFADETTRVLLAESWASFITDGKAAGEYSLVTPRGVRAVEYSAVANVGRGLHLSILRDVGDRKRSEEERQLFVDIVDALQVGLQVWELDPDDEPGGMRLVYANPAALTGFGVQPDTVIGRTLRETFPPFMETTIPSIYAEVARGGEARALGDVTYENDTGTESVFAAQLFPLPGTRVGVAFNDVTSHRRDQAAALRQLDSITDTFVTLDREWRYTYLNDAALEFTGATNEERLGKSVWEIHPSLVGSAGYEECHRAVRDNVSVSFEQHFERVGKWAVVRIFPTPDGVTIFSQEITGRKALEAQLLRAQRLEAVGQLAGGVAHDFNNLLTVISGYTFLALAKVDTDPAFVGNALAEIKNASAKATTLTAKLLTFSRTKPLEAIVARVDEIVAAALELVAPLLGESVTVHRALDAGNANIFAEVAEIDQLIVNLALNARDAMEGPGNLYIATQCVDIAASSTGELARGRYVSLTVRDDGCGMDEETKNQIFDPFFTTKPAGQGTGLGLSTAYGTVGQSGGSIDVASVVGEGTTFTILLPRSAKPVTKPVPAPSAIATQGGERVLVVEDNAVVRRLMLEILTAAEYAVSGAAGPEDALTLTGHQTFDLMITDLLMPGGSGTALAHAVLAQQPEIAILFMSGYKPESVDSFAAEGCEPAFLAKPFDSDSLCRRVRELLDRQIAENSLVPA